MTMGKCPPVGQPVNERTRLKRLEIALGYLAVTPVRCGQTPGILAPLLSRPVLESDFSGLLRPPYEVAAGAWFEAEHALCWHPKSSGRHGRSEERRVGK